jgi:hypothetical protein
MIVRLFLDTTRTIVLDWDDATALAFSRNARVTIIELIDLISTRLTFPSQTVRLIWVIRPSSSTLFWGASRPSFDFSWNGRIVQISHLSQMPSETNDAFNKPRGKFPSPNLGCCGTATNQVTMGMTSIALTSVKR